MIPPHPWRRLRALTDWTLRWAVLPDGILGLTDHRSQIIVLATGMGQAERRSTLAHELEHVDGRTHEPTCDRNAARSLLPDVRPIGEALAWAHDLDEAVDELWVDRPLLEVRLAALHPCERAYLRRRLAEEPGT